MSLKAGFYNLLIEPLLSGLKQSVTALIPADARIIDIACGTGSLAIALAGSAHHVTGIDLDEELIGFARNKAAEKEIRNIDFLVLDAARLSKFRDKEFAYALTSMAVHQFEEKLAIQILREMNRIAANVVLADYNYPLPRRLAGSFAYGIERLAGGDHYRNFRNYMNRGGLDWFAGAAGIKLKTYSVRGYGVFVIAYSGVSG